MGLFKNLFRRDKEGLPRKTGESEPTCPHVVLVPRWDSTEDIGNPEKVTGYLCEGCQASFSFDEGEKLRATEAERVRPEDRE